jgi:hypothetical protein
MSAGNSWAPSMVEAMRHDLARVWSACTLLVQCGLERRHEPIDGLPVRSPCAFRRHLHGSKLFHNLLEAGRLGRNVVEVQLVERGATLRDRSLIVAAHAIFIEKSTGERAVRVRLSVTRSCTLLRDTAA